ASLARHAEGAPGRPPSAFITSARLDRGPLRGRDEPCLGLALAELVHPVRDETPELLRLASRPLDLQELRAGRLSEAEVRPEARPAEAAAAPHERVDFPVPSARGGEHEAEPCADAEAVGGLADQLELHPVIAVAGVLVDRGPETIVRIDATHHLDHVLVSSLVEVAEGHRVALLEVPEAARGRDVLEALAL